MTVSRNTNGKTIRSNLSRKLNTGNLRFRLHPQRNRRLHRSIRLPLRSNRLLLRSIRLQSILLHHLRCSCNLRLARMRFWVCILRCPRCIRRLGVYRREGRRSICPERRLLVWLLGGRSRCPKGSLLLCIRSCSWLVPGRLK